MFSGCTMLSGVATQVAITRYHEAAPRVQLGMSPDEVLAILGPSEAGLPADRKRPPEQFVNADGKRITIYFFRSGWISDGRVSDDEVTPYFFVNEQLIGVGWTAIGGPRS